MIDKKEIYNCSVCNNLVENLHFGESNLICCDKRMENLIEKTEEEGNEKHLPVITELPPKVCQGKDGFKIKIGEIEHPSTEGHFIEWVEINTEDGKSGKKFLEPGETPEAEFYTRVPIKSIRAYCNIHGLWKKEIEK